MKYLKLIVALAAIFVGLGSPLTGRAEDPKPKPYPLDTCLVCGMKFEAGTKPYKFVYKGQEIKLCEKSEKTEFDKDRAKFLKKLAEAEAAKKK
jgi:YHS domain-containing protein